MVDKLDRPKVQLVGRCLAWVGQDSSWLCDGAGCVTQAGLQRVPDKGALVPTLPALQRSPATVSCLQHNDSVDWDDTNHSHNTALSIQPTTRPLPSSSALTFYIQFSLI